MPRSRVRVAVAIAGVVGAAGIAMWLATRDSQPDPLPPRTRPGNERQQRRLDLTAFRADLAQRKAKIEALRVEAETRAKDAAVPYEPPQASTMVSLVIDPECMLGPGELCTSLQDVIEGCDVGDAASCLAVAQYLQDTPPRPTRGVLMFLLAACKRGDAAACQRMEVLKQPFTGTCATDPTACALHSLRTQDRYQLGQACEAGVAETCAWLGKNVGNADARRRYLESACQLGNAAACADLGRRLAASCGGDDCFPTDAEQAAAALAIACAAGYADACK